jgi:hypothetical protein
MNIEELQMTIASLADVEPRSIGTDRQAREAAVWVDMERKTEAHVDSILEPAIKTAFTEHRRLTGEKKTLLEKLLSAKDRVRMNLANWIAAGNGVDGCYVKTKYKVTVTEPGLLPGEYAMMVPDMPEIQQFVDTTEGKVAIPGVSIEPVHILYAKEVK